MSLNAENKNIVIIFQLIYHIVPQITPPVKSLDTPSHLGEKTLTGTIILVYLHAQTS